MQSQLLLQIRTKVLMMITVPLIAMKSVNKPEIRPLLRLLDCKTTSFSYVQGYQIGHCPSINSYFTGCFTDVATEMRRCNALNSRNACTGFSTCCVVDEVDTRTAMRFRFFIIGVITVQGNHTEGFDQIGLVILRDNPRRLSAIQFSE